MPLWLKKNTSRIFQFYFLFCLRLRFFGAFSFLLKFFLQIKFFVVYTPDKIIFFKMFAILNLLPILSKFFLIPHYGDYTL